MRRALCAALTVSALLALPSAAGAASPLVVGIGEQHASIFASPSWAQLKARDIRYIVAWDALDSRVGREETDRYMAAAENAGARVLLGFSRSRSRFKARRKTLPSPRRYRKVFLRFRARYPFITSYLTWNEANHRGQPTWNHPKLVGRYYDILRNNCRECTIVAPSVLDTRAMPGWVKRVEKAAKHRIGIWAIHNYIDANRFRTSGRGRCCARRRRRSGSPRPGASCAATTARGSSSPSAQARGEGHALGAQAAPATEPSGPADLLLPLDRARPEGHLGLGADRPARQPRAAYYVVRTFLRRHRAAQKK